VLLLNDHLLPIHLGNDLACTSFVLTGLCVSLRCLLEAGKLGFQSLETLLFGIEGLIAPASQ